ncbi:MAG: carboxypeptidase-like regulatory domain-containing protein [Bacteroidales bacterium]|nr:carboxypeptidase-like regulatory domain-containing protein [Bacteroidales bacterium]
MVNLNSNKRFGRLIWKTAVCWLGLCFASVALLSGANRDAEGRIVVQPKVKISGTETDKDGFPMPDVTIQIKGKTTGVVTDGKYEYEHLYECEGAYQHVGVAGLTKEAPAGNGKGGDKIKTKNQRLCFTQESIK